MSHGQQQERCSDDSDEGITPAGMAMTSALYQSTGRHSDCEAVVRTAAAAAQDKQKKQEVGQPGAQQQQQQRTARFAQVSKDPAEHGLGKIRSVRNMIVSLVHRTM
jgi:hypothetical protein